VVSTGHLYPYDAGLELDGVLWALLVTGSKVGAFLERDDHGGRHTGLDSALILRNDTGREEEGEHLQVDVVLRLHLRVHAEHVGVGAGILHNVGNGSVRAEEARRKVGVVHDVLGAVSGEQGDGEGEGMEAHLHWD
jgi:hypothetical protein